LKANAGLLALKALRLQRSRVIESLAAHHIIHQQQLHGIPIHRAYVTVHMDRQGRVYLVKNRAVPSDLLEPSARFKISQSGARRRALKSVGKKASAFSVIANDKIWFPLQSRLRPAYRVRIQQRKPRADWVIFVDGENGRVMRKYDNLSEASAPASVFDPNPVIALGGSRQLLRNGQLEQPPREAYTDVTLRDLKSRKRLDGRRVNTSLTRRQFQSNDGQFRFTSDHP